VLLIYGAYGYTGELVARRALEAGLRPVIAGRDRAKVERLAMELSLPHRAFALDDPDAVEGGLAGARAVVHCAGPFVRTFRPMAEACLRARCHYLDLTGEIAVFAGLHAMHAAAESAGVMLLPGAGFDVVPTDCLAAHLVRRLPSATRLALAIEGLDDVSRGTARTLLSAREALRGAPSRPRPLPPAVRRIDLGNGSRLAFSIPWGDVFTAPLSTGIRDVSVYSVPSASTALAFPLLAAVSVLNLDALRDLAVRVLTRGRPGPDAARRARRRSLVWGEAADASGRRVESRLRAPDAYGFSALSAVAIARRVLAGEARPGFQTPSRAFGADLVLDLEGVVREDVA
jgi:short subunit dehydrogenase-like uncharacterized protein